MVFPVEDGPNSFDRSTRIVSRVPSTVISTFFMMICVLLLPIVPLPEDDRLRLDPRSSCGDETGHFQARSNPRPLKRS